MRVGKLGLSVLYGPSDESQPCGDQIYHRLLSARLQGADQPFGQNCHRVAVLVKSMVAWNKAAFPRHDPASLIAGSRTVQGRSPVMRSYSRRAKRSVMPAT